MKLNVREAARLLSVSESEVYRWVEDGEIPCYLVNHQPLFSRAELLEWATARHLPLSIELFEGGTRPLLLAEALTRGGVHYHISVADRDTALRAVVERLPIAEETERELVLSILLAREAQASTAVGDGIAIPHVRTPLVFAGGPPVIALCFLERAVPFGAADGVPVHTLFTMMTPTIRAHLHLLSRLSLALLDPAFRAVVKRRAKSGDILAEARRVDASLASRPTGTASNCDAEEEDER